MATGKNKYVYVFAAIVIIINAIFLLNARLLPFIDLPNHLAEATIFKYHNDATTGLGQFYQPVPWYFPNTFHVVFCSLFPTVEIGNYVFLILYIALFIFSTLLVIRELNGNLWYGLLVTLLLYNMNLGWGFTGFAIAIPTTVLLFYFLLKEVNTGKFIYTIAVGFTLVLLFLMHAQVALFGLVFTALLMLYRYHKSIKDILLKVVFMPLPLVILLFIWWQNRDVQDNESSTLSYLVDYYKTSYLQNITQRINFLFLDNSQLYKGFKGIVVATVINSVILLPLLVAIISKKVKLKEGLFKHGIYPFIFFFCAISCFLILPSSLPGQWPLYQRFSTLLLISMLIVGAVLVKDIQVKWLKPLAIAASFVYLFLWFEYIYNFNKENKDFDIAFYKNAGYPSTSAGLIYDYEYRGRNIYQHFPNYFLVWNKGIAASSMIDFRFGVVRRGVLGNKIPVYLPEEKNIKLDPAYKHTIDYILMRGEPSHQEPDLNHYTLFNQKGFWKLYKNKDSSISMSVTSNQSNGTGKKL